MRMTITNGNARNGIRGQRVTFRTATLTACTIVPRANARKHQPALLGLARAVAWADGVERHKPEDDGAEMLLRLFTDARASLVVKHRRAF